MAYLVTLSGPARGKRFSLGTVRVTLGRDPGCELAVTDAMIAPDRNTRHSVSRRHAVLARIGDEWTVEDGDGKGRASHNGTFVNDHRLPFLDPTALHDGDVIQIGDVRLQFHADDPSTFSLLEALSREQSDRTRAGHSAEQLRLILELGDALRTTIAEDDLLDRVGPRLLTLFPTAERCLVVGCDRADGPLVVRRVHGRDGTADATFCRGVIRRCTQTGEAILGNDLSRQFPDSGSLGFFQTRSLVCAPIWSANGSATRAIQLDTPAGGSPFTVEDLRLLIGVAGQMSLAWQNVELHCEVQAHERRVRDMETARQIQRALLPRSLPTVPGYEFFAHYESAQQVGGDYYDFLTLPDGRLAVLLGDVAGKGVPAALIMAKFSVEARVCLETQADLPMAVGRLNTIFARARLDDRFVTLVALVLDPTSHTVTLVNAGHPAPFLCRAAGPVGPAITADQTGLPIGILEDQEYAGVSIPLGPNDRLVLFSDGVIDAMDLAGNRFGLAAVQSQIGRDWYRADLAGRALVAAVKGHAINAVAFDDMTVVCLGRIEAK
jgi:phosphoserine phosphatase RsbU/P